MAELPTPRYARQVHSEMSVIVDPDGRVNTKLTRYWSLSVDSQFHRRLLEAVHAFRYEAGTVSGQPVRYGQNLSVRTGMRADTIPEQLVWRYVQGVLGDSLVGVWRQLPAEAPLSSAQLVGVARAVTRTLRDMQVLLPEQRPSYCLIQDGPDLELIREAVRRELYGTGRGIWGGAGLAPAGCEADVGHRRYRIGSPIRTGGGRTVVRVSGDFLRNWPHGLDGLWWPGWYAYCVVRENSGATECDITPVFTGDAKVDGRFEERFERVVDRHSPIAANVEVTTIGAYWTDTIAAVIGEVPRFEEHAIVRSDVDLCASPLSWSAIAEFPGAGEIVVWLKLRTDSARRADIHVTEVRRPGPDYRFPGTACSGRPSRHSIVVFALPGVGQPLRGPVRLCLERANCALSFLVDPARHRLAGQPHLRFRLSDLSESARRGAQVHFRLRLDRDIEGLTPFVVVRGSTRISPYLLRRRSAREFDFSVHHTPPFGPDTEFWIYLATFGRM